MFKKVVYPSRSHFNFKGFLLNFLQGFIDLVDFQDYCYLMVSKKVQAKYKFRKGDKLNFYAYLSLDRGRILLTRINRLEVEYKTLGEYWAEGEALVAKHTGSILNLQQEKCLVYERGSLIDVVEISKSGEREYRRFFCLEGVRDPSSCIYRVEKELRMERCLEEEKGSFSRLMGGNMD